MRRLGFSTGLAGVIVALLAVAVARADDWPQWLGPQRDGVWRESGIVEKFPADGPRVRWRTPVGSGYTGPAVAQGRVFVMDRQLAAGATNPDDPFAKATIPGTERVLCLDAADGRVLWKHGCECPYTLSYPAGPRGTPPAHDGKVNALDPQTGTVYWSHKVHARSGLSIPTPRQSGDLLFITSFYNGSLMLRVDSDTPTVVWQSMKVSEKDTDGLHSIMPTPFIADGYLYGVCSYGQFRCLKADTGDRLWETFEPTTGKSERWGNAFITKNGDRYFLFNEKGDLIIARLTPEKYEEISRAHLLEPTNTDPGHAVVWSYPAFANRCVYAPNDKAINCVSLDAVEGSK